MLIDVHTHIFPPEMVNERQAWYGGEPEFRLLYDSPRAQLATVNHLLDMMAAQGLDRAVVFGFPWRQTDLATRHNDYVLEAAARYAPALIPLACVNPLAPASEREADRCLAQGARGLGELALYGAVETAAALSRLQDLTGCCRAHGGIMLMHANEPVGHHYPGKSPLGLDFYYALAGLTRDVPLILAHWGGGLGFYELLRREAQDILHNVYYDTAASPFLYRPAIYAHMTALVGEEKILWGSDYPLLSPERYFREMKEAGLPNETVSALTGANAARLFGIEETKDRL